MIVIYPAIYYRFCTGVFMTVSSIAFFGFWFQLVTQVLNRVTSHSNMFDIVVSSRMPGLETVDHYPVLVAVSGILTALLCKSSEAR